MRLTIIPILMVFLTILFLLPWSVNPIHADNMNGVEIVDIQVKPSVVRVGQEFSISATLLNNSTFPINVRTDDCNGQFSLSLDHHVKINKSNSYCLLTLTYYVLDSGKTFTGIDPPLGTLYVANSTGVVNANATFSYVVPSQLGGKIETISKTFSFPIRDNGNGSILTDNALMQDSQSNSTVISNDSNFTPLQNTSAPEFPFTTPILLISVISLIIVFKINQTRTN